MTVGSKITGDQLATMLKDYVKAVNDPDTIPAVKSAWDASVELRCKKILEDMVVKYNTDMTAAIEEACLRGSEMDPMEERSDPENATGTSLMSIHDTVMNNVRNELNKQIRFLGWDKDNQDHSTLLFDLNERMVKRDSQGQENSNIVGGELFRYIQKNRDRSRRYCDKVFKRLLDELKKRLYPIPDGYTKEKLDADMAQLKESYSQQAIGPMKLDVLRERLDSSDMPGFFQMCVQIEELQRDVAKAKKKQEMSDLKLEKQSKELQYLCDESARKETKYKKDLEKVSQNHETALRKQKEEHDNERRRLNGRIQDLEETNHINAAERAKQIEELQRDVAKAKKKQEMSDLKLEKQSKELQYLCDESARKETKYKKDLEKVSQNHETALRKQKEEHDNERRRLNGKIQDLEKKNHTIAAEWAKAEKEGAGAAVSAYLQGLAFRGSQIEIQRVLEHTKSTCFNRTPPFQNFPKKINNYVRNWV
ncbi:myosin-4 isoform X2 [Lingula anatina]|uniref:Myosin-4 isoform X2 n=1 Tax=Lingula anatina TaxID=7574 RepID=A0A1S3J0Z4_LINAN|nr:myosin-4 isoform X2 [Lingula anatina]|eukprot:XP_013403926.1 myosin-4 isoform X2 [Lingula anatina]